MPTIQSKFDESNQPDVIRSADYRIVYSNNVRLRMSENDIQLTFALLVDVIEGKTPKFALEEKTAVIVTPKQAKVLAESLAQAISEYEKSFGAISTHGPDA